jgi:tocopherol O-methyltransferase
MNELNQKIAKFYNTSTQLWLDVWGEHMHQGFYGNDGSVKKNHLQAQVDLIDELINWGDIQNAENIFDAGCGVGGSARYLSKKLGSNVTGYTLSHVQAAKAKQINDAAGFQNKIQIIEGDMLSIDPDNEKFDLIWSLESAEHIFEKEKLIKLFYDLLIPGGKLIIGTWCVRNENPAFSKNEISLINKVRRNYHLPPMISIDTYKKIAEKAGFKNVIAEDWSKMVVPFWDAVYKSALKWKSIAGLLRAGLPAIKGALTIRHMKKGYRTGIIQFGVLQGEK